MILNYGYEITSMELHGFSEVPQHLRGTGQKHEISTQLWGLWTKNRNTDFSNRKMQHWLLRLHVRGPAFVPHNSRKYLGLLSTWQSYELMRWEYTTAIYGKVFVMSEIYPLKKVHGRLLLFVCWLLTGRQAQLLEASCPQFHVVNKSFMKQFLFFWLFKVQN